ncbi:MAG: hypothetical protein HQL69_18310 [Magnetococcales bacterium]|nr:hypothetical protein [Magnetococcales bacterium]
MNLKQTALALLALTAGCVPLSHEAPHVAPLKSGTLISRGASSTGIFYLDPDDKSIICTQPPPDAALDSGQSWSFGLSMLNFGGKDSGSDAETADEVEMEGRTPALLLSRELLYRFCEFSRNYKVTKEEAIDLYRHNLKIIEGIAHSEAEHTTITIGESLSVTDSQTVTSETKEKGDNSPINNDAQGDINESGQDSSAELSPDTYDPNESGQDSDADPSPDTYDPNENGQDSGADPITDQYEPAVQ